MNVHDLPHPMAIRKALDEYVIGQPEAKMTASVVLRNHLARLFFAEFGPSDCAVQEFDKNNLLIIGPTGSGKTHIAETLARITNLPFHAGDATKITQAGYVGGDVEDLVAQLYIKSGNNLERAQRGIVFIDEVDKIRASGEVLDVNGAAVQRALLTLLNGSKVTIKTPTGPIEFDTTNVLFIVAGAFVGLDGIVERRKSGKSTIGYGGNPVSREEDPVKRLNLLFDVTSDDLVMFGLIPEFVGRLQVRTVLHPLDETALLKILTVPKNSLVDQAHALLSGCGGARFEDSAYAEIAREASKTGTGARALVEILDGVVGPIVYLQSPEVTIIDAERVRNRKQYEREAALSPVPEHIEPCRFEWPGATKQEQVGARVNETSAGVGASGASAAAAPRRPHADKLVCRPIWTRGDDDRFMRLLSGKKNKKMYVVGRVFDIECDCGCVTRVPVEFLLEYNEGIDPLEYLQEERVTYHCSGCSTEQESDILDLGPSEWTPPKKKQQR